MEERFVDEMESEKMGGNIRENYQIPWSKLRKPNIAKCKPNQNMGRNWDS